MRHGPLLTRHEAARRTLRPATARPAEGP
jgi:hypothetical protein